MKQTISRDALQTFSAIANDVGHTFNDEQKKDFDPVIFKILNAETGRNGYEVDLTDEDKKVVKEVLRRAKENNSEIANSDNFAALEQNLTGIAKTSKEENKTTK